ncbi:MAG: hypothetical protein QHH24_00025 [Candidatus Bathyarchaeota archaeon]|nr:hypothetical protein [Candidatus Bathyarchaeota archaeon]
METTENTTQTNEPPAFQFSATLSEETESEEKLQDLLTILNQETQQLSEYITEENVLAKEVCRLLKHVLKEMQVSLNIPAHSLNGKDKVVKKAVLDEEGCLTLIYENNEKTTATLAEYPPHIVMAVLRNVVPELAKAVNAYKKRLNVRTKFLENVKKELKSLVKAISANTEQERYSEEELKK